MRGRSWAVVGLVAVLVFDVGWRGHTVGLDSAAEPLDCDEAIYAYIGKRIAGGDVMYRDLAENKPPLGYWLFALAVEIGGASERTVRLMPVPFVLANAALVWWLGLRLRGPGAAVLAAAVYAVVSTDPFLYGNGDQMEHLINLPATAALALVVSAWDRPGRSRLVAAGACVGAAMLVKQVAALNGAVFALALLLRGTWPRPSGRIKDVVALAAGAAAVCGLAALVVVAQGAGRQAFDDIFRFGPALALDVPGGPFDPPFLVRCVTGNADSTGRLPWPFGRTDNLVWWGTGSWPVWLAAVPGLAWLAFGPGAPASATRRLVAVWTLSTFAEVAVPRLFWAHYYLLPVPGLAVVVAVFVADLAGLARSRRRALPALGALAVAAALGWTARTQVVEYWRVAPEDVAIRAKGGRQWVILRDLGRELAWRSTVWPRPTLYVWGWQSPLFVYSGLDGVTREAFANELMKTYADGNHPQVAPRVERTMRDLRANPPSLIFAGYPPFPALRAFLDERYLLSRLSVSSPDGRGLWVERDHYGEFETRTPPARGGRPK